MKYICAQPPILYYEWQLHIFLKSLITHGIDAKDICIITLKDHPKASPTFQTLGEIYGVQIYYYPDTRKSIVYIPSIRHHLLIQHWQSNPELINEVVFYCDSDILLRQPLNLHDKLNDDIWYVSDAKSYIGHDYIKQHGVNVLDKMCAIVGIKKSLVKEQQNNSGGAQYLLKHVTTEFWQEVYDDSINLFTELSKYNQTQEKLSKKPQLQIWCADMWAILWNAWKRGITTKITSDFDFSWGSSTQAEWDNKPIYHNAGVIKSDCDGQFCKANYIDMLPPADLQLHTELANKNYYQVVQAVLYGDNI
jgi:hypothetical protein